MRSYITAKGVITPAGYGSEILWSQVREGKSYIHNGLGLISDDDLVEYQKIVKSKFPNINFSSNDRALVIALAALSQLKDLSIKECDAFLFATTGSEIDNWEKKFFNYIDKNITIDELMPLMNKEVFSNLKNSICDAMGFKGYSNIITTACCASTQAIIAAKNLIDSGFAKRCLVGAVETVNTLTKEGFSSFKLLSSNAAIPFDKNRSGINLSEASVFFLIESEDVADKDSRLIEICSGAFFSDVFHSTAPHPEGLGIYKAMNSALDLAKINVADIDWIHCHGTGSVQNDAAEGNAISTLLTHHKANISSTKNIHGHALGASGALEIALDIEAVKNQCILPNFGLEVADTSITICNFLLTQEKKQKINYILKTSLGFGGANAAIVLKDSNS